MEAYAKGPETTPIPLDAYYDAMRAEDDLALIVKRTKEVEWYKLQIEQAEAKIQRAKERLTAFAIHYRQTVGPAQVSLRGGSLMALKARERTEIYDKEAWQEWIQAQPWVDDFWDEPQPRLNESKVKQALQSVADGSFIFEGETVPGIRRIIPGPHDFTVKINAGRNIEEAHDDDAE